MSRSASYIVVYDIANNKERNHVVNILIGFGQRVQKSVFECRLSTSLREKLSSQLEGLDLQTGFILMYRLNNQAKRMAFGKIPDCIKDEEEHAFVI